MEEFGEKVILQGHGYVEFQQAEVPAWYSLVADAECRVLNIALSETEFKTPEPGTEDIFLYMNDGRRIHMKVGEHGKLIADGRIQQGWHDRQWDTARSPLPLTKAYTLTVWSKGQRIYQSTRPTLEEAKLICEGISQPFDSAEIRPRSGKIIKLR